MMKNSLAIADAIADALTVIFSHKRVKGKTKMSFVSKTNSSKSKAAKSSKQAKASAAKTKTAQKKK